MAATPDKAQRRIERGMLRRLSYYAQHRQDIDSRLAELEREWDVERVLEVKASGLMLLGLGLGVGADRRFLFLPAVVGGFLLQHALQGWCPPLPVLRRLGVRTAAEIARERYALKALRGDFDALSSTNNGSSGLRLQRTLAAVMDG